MKKFKHIATLIKVSRQKTDLSQETLANEIGFRNGQFISNVERGKCSISDRLISNVARALGILEQQIIDAKLDDYADSLNKYRNNPADVERYATRLYIQTKLPSEAEAVTPKVGMDLETNNLLAGDI